MCRSILIFTSLQASKGQSPDMVSLQNKVEEQSAVITKQGQILTEVMQRLSTLDDQKAFQQSIIENQEDTIGNLQLSLERQDRQMRNLEKTMVETQASINADPRYGLWIIVLYLYVLNGYYV